MRGLAESAAWAGRLAGVLRHDDVVGEPADYLQIMLDAGCDADAWETTYQQLLTGTEPGAGVGARRRPPARAGRAVRRGSPRVRGRILAPGWPRPTRPAPHGTVFPFRRIFAVARNGTADRLRPQLPRETPHGLM